VGYRFRLGWRIVATEEGLGVWAQGPQAPALKP